MRRRRLQQGQALVELVALLPVLVVGGVLAWQMVVAGHVWTLAAGAARAGERALEVGAPAGPAALAALPARYAMSADVVTLEDAAGGARVRVRLAVPRLLPVLPDPGYIAVEAGAAAAVAALGR
jgi:hypothetical protein